MAEGPDGSLAIPAAFRRGLLAGVECEAQAGNLQAWDASGHDPDAGDAPLAETLEDRRGKCHAAQTDASVPRRRGMECQTIDIDEGLAAKIGEDGLAVSYGSNMLSAFSFFACRGSWADRRVKTYPPAGPDTTTKRPAGEVPPEARAVDVRPMACLAGVQTRKWTNHQTTSPLR